MTVPCAHGVRRFGLSPEFLGEACRRLQRKDFGAIRSGAVLIDQSSTVHSGGSLGGDGVQVLAPEQRLFPGTSRKRRGPRSSAGDRWCDGSSPRTRRTGFGRECRLRELDGVLLTSRGSQPKSGRSQQTRRVGLDFARFTWRGHPQPHGLHKLDPNTTTTPTKKTRTPQGWCPFRLKMADAGRLTCDPPSRSGHCGEELSGPTWRIRPGLWATLSSDDRSLSVPRDLVVMVRVALEAGWSAPRCLG